MRLEISSENRIGITQEVLAVLAGRGIDVRLVEVIAHHIYLDAPGLAASDLAELSALIGRVVTGVERVRPVELLPMERRRMQLHSVFSAISDPLLAVDGANRITQANPAAARCCGLPDENALRERRLTDFLGQSAAAELRAAAWSLSEREVTFNGVTFLLRSEPIRTREAPAGAPRGGVLIFQRPHRLGQMMSALRTPGAAGGFDTIIGAGPALRAAKARARRLAGVDAPLLILGETGAGKELFARAVHASSRRADKPFLALNCAALPEGLAESELFGYVAGAFTDARKGGKPGLVEMAAGGSLFLDEVGELSPYLQVKLLRVLQDGSFRRVGGARETTVDIRVISATNRALEDMIQEGRFREELYFRLNVLNLTLPPLRERLEDLAALAERFIARAAAQVGRPAPALEAGALDALAVHDWPGNVRELENILFRAVSLLEGDTLNADHLRLCLRPDGAGGPAADAPAPDSYAGAFDRFEKQLLERLYPAYPSTRKLARRLGLSHTTVAEKLRRHGLSGA